MLTVSSPLVFVHSFGKLNFARPWRFEQFLSIPSIFQNFLQDLHPIYILLFLYELLAVYYVDIMSFDLILYILVLIISPTLKDTHVNFSFLWSAMIIFFFTLYVQSVEL